MRLWFVANTIGLLCLIFSGALLPPFVISLLYADNEANHLGATMLVLMFVGLVLWFARRNSQVVLRARDGFLVVAALWLVVSMLGSIPLLMGLDLDVTDAVFESVSAFTTTGATVLSGLDDMPPSLLFFRQEMQWLGGIGVVVSAIALLPMLGVGGMQLLKAETPGPMKEERLTPRVAQTARMLWRLYLAMTVSCALLYWLGGMNAFDAVAHSLATVSTGGFSTHDASFGYYDSTFIESVAIVFMLLGAINFGIHFVAWRNLSPAHYWRNEEVRTFFGVILVVIVTVALELYVQHSKSSMFESFRYAAFTVVSVITSTGFGLEDFSVWPTLSPVLLIFISFMGGCAGSTAGGMKTIRFMVIVKQVGSEVQSLIHPSVIKPLKVGGQVVPAKTVQSIWAYVGAYVGLFACMMLLLMGMGMDQVTAFSGVATCMNNLGPGLGEVTSSFAGVSDPAKWIFSAAMLLGRLEVFTLFVLFTPGFWRS
jgi:trk system potassium uptake protein TrkH